MMASGSSSDSGERQRLLGADSDSYLVSSDQIRQYDHQEYVTYKRRWYLLGVVCLLNVSNAMIWISFSPIADLTASFYGVDAMSVNWLSLVFPIATLPFGFLATWMLDTLGLRLGMISASWMNVIGAVLRVVSTVTSVPLSYRYPLVLTGQIFSACAQPFLLFAPTKVAAVWFKDTQRATANMLSSMANPLGILIANILAPVIVKRQNELALMMELFAGPAALGALLATFGICSAVPPSPPTASAEELSEPFLAGLKKIMKDKTYWCLAVCFGVGLALFTALTTLLEQILCAHGYSDTFAGLCGALLIGLGIVGAAMAGVYVDRTKKFEEVAKIGYGMAAISLIFFTLISKYQDQQILVGISVGLFGFFGFSLYPICLELAVECTYPVAEATSSGFLIMSGQLQGIVYILLMQVGAQPLKGSDITRQTCLDMGGQSGIQALDYTYSNLGMCVVTVLSAIVFITCFKCKYKRLQTEQQLAAERILNINPRQRPHEFF